MMTALTRLRLTALMIIFSALYAVIVVQDPGVASAVSSGYIAILLTVFIIVEIWRRP